MRRLNVDAGIDWLENRPRGTASVAVVAMLVLICCINCQSDSGRRIAPSNFVKTPYSPRESWTRTFGDSNAMVPLTLVERVTIHHDAAYASPRMTRSSAVRRLESIRKFHAEERGWSDIGYHFLIDPHGTLWEGRDRQFRGAHAGNQALNHNNLGICLLGNFSEQQVPKAQRDALAAFLDRLRERYRLAAADIAVHSELVSTECPGAALRAWVESYRSEISR